MNWSSDYPFLHFLVTYFDSTTLINSGFFNYLHFNYMRLDCDEDGSSGVPNLYQSRTVSDALRYCR